MTLLLLALACQDTIQKADDSDTGSSSTEGFRFTALSPDSGPASGGTTVSLQGTGLTEATEVSFGGRACSSLAFLSSSELTCLTPPGVPGTINVTLTEGEESTSLPFTYLSDSDTGTDTGDTGDTGTDTGTDTGDTGDTGTSGGLSSCRLVDENLPTIYVGESTVMARGRASVAGRTEASGATDGLLAEIAYGAEGSSPSSWTWAPMGYLSDEAEGEVHGAALTPASAGRYNYMVRFSLDGSFPVTCTTTRGTSLGNLEVLATSDPEPVDYCHLQFPCSATVASGAASPTVYVRVYQPGVTTSAGAGPGLRVELGVGPDGSDPSVDSSTWFWSRMIYNVDADGLTPGDMANDEYQGTLVGPAVSGRYDYAGRASIDGGVTWTYCDFGGTSCGGNGSRDGYSPSTAGDLTVP